jgi:glycogen synthase
MYNREPETFRALQKTCMEQDFSWDVPAQKYMDQFRRMLQS